MQTFFFFLRAKKNDEGGRRQSSRGFSRSMWLALSGSRTKKTKLKCQLREINSFPWDSIQLSVFYLKYNFYK